MVQGFGTERVTAYKEYLIAILETLGVPRDRSDDQVSDVIKLQIRLAELSMTQIDERDPAKTNNPIINDKLKNKYGINWMKFFMPLRNGIKTTQTTMFNLLDKKYIEGLADVLKDETAGTLANYLMLQYVHFKIKLLGDKFHKEAKLALNRIVSGKTAQPPRWEKCVERTLKSFPRPVSQIYVEAKFNGEAKNKVNTMISEIVGAMREELEGNNWMQSETKKKAVAKLDNMVRFAGHPDDLMEEGDEYDNMVSPDIRKYFVYHTTMTKHNLVKERKKFDKAVERNEWMFEDYAQVNAFYHPNYNAILFPAAVLSPPFFYAEGPMAINFMLIGTVIGHEITHGFDDVGRAFDSVGNQVKWWDQETAKLFDASKECFVEQYSAIVAKDVNMNLDGEKTIGENIADNGAIRIALKAHKNWREKNSAYEKKPVGLENLSWSSIQMMAHANMFCSLIRPEKLVEMITTETHNDFPYRLNTVLKNYEGFSETFQCPSGKPMNPAKRCKLW